MTINFETANPHEILEFVQNGGEIDGSAIDALTRHLNSDWIIDIKEAEFLFQVNQAIGDRDEENEAWAGFFCDNIGKLILFDLHTPGEIDEAEGNWLADMLDQYGCNNRSEKQLVDHIRKSAKSIAGRFS